ncbi:MAG: protein-glutamate O-methyltransferase CheR [Gammaproteobacteria bacterium]|nr:protein-glutamate O-methyltransferase CheR [Gammaproteobacteria bacterium]
MENQIPLEDYNRFRAFLERSCGIVLGDNKQYLVTSRLTPIMSSHGLPDLHALMHAVDANAKPGLKEQVVDAMTTNETQWFRDIYPYETLKTIIFPEFAKLSDRPLRIWSAACSYGQEPYSISMVIQEYLLSHPTAFSRGIQIVATDISPTVLKQAKEGVYDATSMARGLSEERRKMFFTPMEGGKWVINQELRGRISFVELNLMSNYAPLGKFDIIFCRNVLIYFSADLKKGILNRMAEIMHPKAHLILGGSESPTNYTDVFEMVRSPHGVNYRLKSKP